MDAAAIAALVKSKTPDHAGHTQELLEYDGIEGTVRLMCSCTVGLTIELPKAPPAKEVRRGA